MKNAHRYFISVAIFMTIYIFCPAVSFANIRSDDFDTDYYLQKGIDYFVKENFTEAVDAFKKAILLDPNNANTYILLGSTYGRLKNYTEAADAFKKAIRLDPDNANAYVGLGVSYTGLKHYTEALDAYKKAINLDPKDVNAYTGLGEIYYYKIKSYSEAVDAFKQAAELNPKDVSIWKNLALSYKEKNDYKNAIVSINRAIEIDSGDHEVMDIQASAHLLSGDIEKAEQSYGKALELLLKDIEKEKTAEKYGSASWCALFVQRFSDAEKYAKEGLSIDLSAHWIHVNLGHAHLFQNKKTEALAEYRKFIEQDQSSGKSEFIKTIKEDFSLLKKRYPDKTALIEWAEKELGI